MDMVNNGSDGCLKSFKNDENKENNGIEKGDLDSVGQKRKEGLSTAERKRIKEEEEAALKKAQALKSMKYLLGKSVKYSNFFQEKLQRYHLGSKSKKKTALEEIHVEDLMNSNVDKSKETITSTIDVTKQIKLFEGGTLRQYQIEGLTWMIVLFENGVNGILADEMGLGKTIQVIALICYLIQRQINGPFLIVAPLSTIPNWVSEFKKFAPKVPVILFHGDMSERQKKKREILSKKFLLGERPVRPVVITSFNVPLLEENFFKAIKWQYVIVDEGQRIKNHNSKLAQILRSLSTVNKLLLTGTPLQNNLTELWALLNFLLPHIFSDMEAFASFLMVEDMETDKIVNQERKNNVVSMLHKVLAPFMLRRIKSDVLPDLVPKKEVLVYCPLTQLQRDLYTYIIQKNIAKLQGKVNDDDHLTWKEEAVELPKKKRACVLKKKTYTEKEEDDVNMLFYEDNIENEKKTLIEKERCNFIYRLTLQNNMMMFKKIVDHPFLVHFPLDPNSKEKRLLVDEQLVQQSGKMLVLDAMLAKLKKKKHKVLLFSTLAMLLDMIEDYLIMRNYKYCRLDGSYSLSDRQESIQKFNQDPHCFVFLISTRAGGLGLNLTAADTVILYDRDWNPQVDIQAQDRCHRIGQKKPVVVYTLVTKNTIDERIIHFGNLKRRLEKIVIQDGKFKSLKKDERTKAQLDLKELEDLLHSSDCSQKIHSNGFVFSDAELEKLLDRSDLYRQMEEKNLKHGER